MPVRPQEPEQFAPLRDAHQDAEEVEFAVLG